MDLGRVESRHTSVEGGDRRCGGDVGGQERGDAQWPDLDLIPA
jgi:hypothetical protein